MDNEILFMERQRFTQWWLWLLLLSINAVFLFFIFKQAIGHKVNIGLILGGGINLLMTILFFASRLDTEIRIDGIYVRFFPYHFTFRVYSWDKLSKVYVRQYSAIGEYGGWGLRYGLSGAGKAYNVAGNMGIQLIMNDGSKLLIGTDNSEEMIKLLKQMDRYRE
jgi:hypothetical protein